MQFKIIISGNWKTYEIIKDNISWKLFKALTNLTLQFEKVIIN